MSLSSEFFTELMFGSGSYLALFIVIALMLIITKLTSYGFILVMPIAFLLGMEYLDQDLGWHGLILIFVGIFLTGHNVLTLRGKHD
jgi:hypothetical protein